MSKSLGSGDNVAKQIADLEALLAAAGGGVTGSGGGKPDISSLLQHIQSLQSAKDRMSKELEEERARVSKLQEGKREDMKKIFDTVITEWLEKSVADEGARRTFADGMQRLITDTKEDNGVWTVAVAASALHKKQVEQIEELRTEVDKLKSESAGSFKSEENRKRPRAVGEGAAPYAPGSGFDFWDEFEPRRGGEGAEK